MASKKTTRLQSPIRYRKMRSDAELANIAEWLEEHLGLPGIQFVKPDGTLIPMKSTVRRLRKAYA